MKKILTIAALVLFTLSASAQDKTKKESCSATKASTEKAMTAADIEKCKIKCKAEGKICDAKMAHADEKKCDATMATAGEKKCCSKKA